MWSVTTEGPDVTALAARSRVPDTHPRIPAHDDRRPLDAVFGDAYARALRTRGVFHKPVPPELGSALAIRHLFPGGGVIAPVTRSQYVLSVYEAWRRFTV
jgi:hypothetical protein